MGLLKRNGIYYLEYKDGSKYKRVSLKTKNKDLAQKMYESYLLSQIKDKINVRRNSDIVSISAFQPSCLQAHQKTNLDTNKRHSIEKSYIEYIDLCESQNLSHGVIQAKKRLNDLLKKNKIKYLDEIDQKLLNHIVNDYQKDMANHHIKNLKAFLNFCIKKRYYTREDFESLTFIKQSESIRDITIDENDYSKLIKNIDDKDFLLYLKTLWNTGVRPNEITQLKKSEIDFESGTAKIYQSKTKK